MERPFIAVIGANGIPRVEITGGSHYFDPDVSVVKANAQTELKVKMAGGSTPLIVWL